MGKKKFIDKNNSQKFHLLHRSARDAAHLGEGNPSEFVLVPSETLNDRKKAHRLASDDGSVQSGAVGSIWANKGRIRDHINEFGFVNDGYDYSQHFTTADSGTIIANNELSSLLLRNRNLDLPDEVFAVGEFNRNFNAVTISEECMDEDLRAALFDDAEEGEFEELDDDFIQQAMEEPTAPDFDFDAHLARLLNASETQLGIRNTNTRNNRAMGGGIDEDDDEDGDEFPDFEDDEDGEGREEEEQGWEDDAAFDAALKREYGDSSSENEDGEDDEDEDDEVNAPDAIELTAEPFEQAMDDFLADLKQEEHFYVAPAVPITLNVKGQDEEELDTNVEVDFKAEYTVQLAQQAAWLEEINELAIESKNNDKAIPTCQEYLRVERVHEEWDCESVLSTLSTTDNLPTRLGPANSNQGKRRIQDRFKLQHQPQQLPPSSSSSVMSNSFNNKSTICGSSIAGSNANQSKIELAGKLNLPQGFDPRKSAAIQQAQLERQKEKEVIATQREKERLQRVNESNAEDKGDDDEQSNDEESADGSDDSDFIKDNKSKKETAEEKKARKAQVKADRRTKRAAKKQVKKAFRVESSRLVRNLAQPGVENVSVFRYST